MLSYQIETLCRIKTTDGQPPSRKHLDPSRGTQCSNVRKQPHSVVYYFWQSLKAPTATFRDAFFLYQRRRRLPLPWRDSEVSTLFAALLPPSGLNLPLLPLYLLFYSVWVVILWDILWHVSKVGTRHQLYLHVPFHAPTKKPPFPTHYFFCPLVINIVNGNSFTFSKF